MSYIGVTRVLEKLREHIAHLNATSHADEPICDDLATWHKLGVYTPEDLDAWIEPPPRRIA